MYYLSLPKLILAAMLCGLLTSALAERLLPLGKLGELTASEYPYVKINSVVYHLSPGARLYNQENRTILPTMLPANAAVLYRLDPSGDIAQIWLLTAQELTAYQAKTR